MNEEQDAPVQEDQEEIEITGVNEIIDTESIASNVRISYRESNLVQILGPKRKYKYTCKLLRWKYKQKKVTNNQILGWNKQKQHTKRVHPQHGITDSREDRIKFSGSKNYGNNDKLNKEPRHNEDFIIHVNIQLETRNKEIWSEMIQSNIWWNAKAP